MNSSLTDAKLGSVDGRFVASVVGGGVGVDNSGGGVKDCNDCGMTVENTGEDSEITKTGMNIYKKGQKQNKMDKTRHENGKSTRNQSRRHPHLLRTKPDMRMERVQ
ncbi:hypothetical protein Tco_1339265 [Tanacetum coccineum]